MQTTNSITFTVANPTAQQISAIASILDGTVFNAATKAPVIASLAPLATQGKKGGKAPTKTVSEDEDETYGTSAIEESEFDEVIDEDEEDAEPTVSFDEVKAAINKYGQKNPKNMQLILAGFNIKSTKELKAAPSKWEVVLMKINKAIKASKK